MVAHKRKILKKWIVRGSEAEPRGQCAPRRSLGTREPSPGGLRRRPLPPAGEVQSAPSRFFCKAGGAWERGALTRRLAPPTSPGRGRGAKRAFTTFLAELVEPRNEENPSPGGCAADLSRR